MAKQGLFRYVRGRAPGAEKCALLQKRRLRGFTVIELVTVMAMAGVLLFMAAPYFLERGGFDSRAFYDQTLSTLRYAQKAAIAQNRFVCVDIAANGITVTYDAITPGASHAAAVCPGLPLTPPFGQAPYVVDVPAGISLSGSSGVNFSPLGRPDAAKSISVSGYAYAITVEAETGYVH